MIGWRDGKYPGLEFGVEGYRYEELVRVVLSVPLSRYLDAHISCLKCRDLCVTRKVRTNALSKLGGISTETCCPSDLAGHDEVIAAAEKIQGRPIGTPWARDS